jgi:ParB family chromosome partitioning protein
MSDGSGRVESDTASVLDDREVDDEVQCDVFVSEREQMLFEQEERSGRFGPHLSIPVDQVRPWLGNARRYEELDAARLGSLIKSIEHDGQRMAAVVRPIKDEVYRFEVITGTRRLWAINYLNQQGCDLPLMALCRPLTDEEAFREADIENREREDVSTLERAQNYAFALDTYYDGQQDKMAQALKISQATLSRLLKVAKLPEDVLGAFGTKDVPLLAAPKLFKALQKPERADHILAEARIVCARQEEARQLGEAELPAAKVAALLLAARGKKAEARSANGVNSKFGKPMIKLVSSSKNSLTLRVDARSGASEVELQEAFIQLVKCSEWGHLFYLPSNT